MYSLLRNAQQAKLDVVISEIKYANVVAKVNVHVGDGVDKEDFIPRQSSLSIRTLARM